MKTSDISFRLRTHGASCDNHEYRVSVLPRVGEFFEDGRHMFRVTHVVHRSQCITDVYAVKDSPAFGCVGVGF